MTFLLFFNRLFAVNKTTKWAIRGAMVANSIFYVIVFFKSIFGCSPVARAYNPAIPGHCAPENGLPYATGVWGFLSDLYILILPMPIVWHLNMKKGRKFKITMAFSVGLL